METSTAVAEAEKEASKPPSMQEQKEFVLKFSKELISGQGSATFGRIKFKDNDVPVPFVRVPWPPKGQDGEVFNGLRAQVTTVLKRCGRGARCETLLFSAGCAALCRTGVESSSPESAVECDWRGSRFQSWREKR